MRTSFASKNVSILSSFNSSPNTMDCEKDIRISMSNIDIDPSKSLMLEITQARWHSFVLWCGKATIEVSSIGRKENATDPLAARYPLTFILKDFTLKLELKTLMSLKYQFRYF